MGTYRRYAAPDRVRDGCFTPLRIDGQWCCLDCRQPMEQPKTFTGKKCRPRLRCDLCRALRHLNTHILSGRYHAGQAVSRARKDGELPTASDFNCTDCGGRRADCYDHRDYGEPLLVVPVCYSCNVMRGPGKPLNPILVAGLLLAAFGEA